MTGFNSVAQDYDAWYNSPLGAFVDEVECEMAFRDLKVTSGMKVLDVGCGTGIYSKRLLEKGCKVIGVDIADKMIEIARDKVPEAHFSASSVYALPFPDNHFDLVFSMATFEFIKNEKAAYFEMKRVAKPGAQIFVGTINRDSSWGELYLAEKHNLNSVFYESHFKTKEDLISIDEDCLLKTIGGVFFPPETNRAHLNWESEKNYAKTERPGFIAALWEKEHYVNG